MIYKFLPKPVLRRSTRWGLTLVGIQHRSWFDSVEVDKLSAMGRRVPFIRVSGVLIPEYLFCTKYDILFSYLALLCNHLDSVCYSPGRIIWGALGYTFLNLD